MKLTIIILLIICSLIYYSACAISKNKTERIKNRVKMCKSCNHFGKLTYDDMDLEIDWCYEPSSGKGAVAPIYCCDKYEQIENN